MPDVGSGQLGQGVVFAEAFVDEAAGRGDLAGGELVGDDAGGDLLAVGDLGVVADERPAQVGACGMFVYRCRLRRSAEIRAERVKRV